MFSFMWPLKQFIFYLFCCPGSMHQYELLDIVFFLYFREHIFHPTTVYMYILYCIITGAKNNELIIIFGKSKHNLLIKQNTKMCFVDFMYSTV